MKNFYKICLLMSTISISISAIYFFILRPIQNDKKLEDCLLSASYVKDDEWYKYQHDLCIKKYR